MTPDNKGTDNGRCNQKVGTTNGLRIQIYACIDGLLIAIWYCGTKECMLVTIVYANIGDANNGSSL